MDKKPLSMVTKGFFYVNVIETYLFFFLVFSSMSINICMKSPKQNPRIPQMIPSAIHKRKNTSLSHPSATNS